MVTERSLLRVVSHHVAHVHLDRELLQVDGEHHQGLPRCPLLTGCLTVLTVGGGRSLCHRIWRRRRSANINVEFSL